MTTARHTPTEAHSRTGTPLVAPSSAAGTCWHRPARRETLDADDYTGRCLRTAAAN